MPAADSYLDDSLLEELLGDDLLLSDDELLGEDYLTDFSDDQSVEDWLKAIEAETAQSLEAPTPTAVEQRTAPDALPEELGEPPPEDYGAHRLRRGSATQSRSAPVAPVAPSTRVTPAEAAPPVALPPPPPPPA